MRKRRRENIKTGDVVVTHAPLLKPQAARTCCLMFKVRASNEHSRKCVYVPFHFLLRLWGNSARFHRFIVETHKVNENHAILIHSRHRPYASCGNIKVVFVVLIQGYSNVSLSVLKFHSSFVSLFPVLELLFLFTSVVYVFFVHRRN